jgi:hypothetical protein
MDARHKCGIDRDFTAGDPPVTYHFRYANQPYRYAGYSTGWGTNDVQYGSGVAQAPLDSPSVFNFFKPSYLPPGEMTTRSLVGPEFQLQTDSIIANTVNAIEGRAYYYDLADACDPDDEYGDVKANFNKDLAIASSTDTGGNGGPAEPANRLVDAYNKRFLAGQMSPFMRQTLLTYLNQISSSSYGSDWREGRIHNALYLISNSPEYQIQK